MNGQPKQRFSDRHTTIERSPEEGQVWRRGIVTRRVTSVGAITTRNASWVWYETTQTRDGTKGYSTLSAWLLWAKRAELVGGANNASA